MYQLVKLVTMVSLKLLKQSTLQETRLCLSKQYKTSDTLAIPANNSFQRTAFGGR